jgi:hypothetical protein
MAPPASSVALRRRGVVIASGRVHYRVAGVLSYLLAAMRTRPGAFIRDRTYRAGTLAGIDRMRWQGVGMTTETVAGGVVTWREWSSGTVFDEDTSRAFGVVVGSEFAVAGLGALVLARRRRSDLTPAWVALVVGVHLFPVAALLGYPLIHVVAALVILVAVARSRGVAVSAVTGLATGSVLLAAGLVALATAVAGM